MLQSSRGGGPLDGPHSSVVKVSASILARTACLTVALAWTSVTDAQSANNQVNGAPRVLGTAQSEQEFDAYRAVLAASDAHAAAAAAESFLQQYSNSGLAPYVHQSAVRAYSQLGDMEQIIRHGEAALVDLPGNALLLSLVGAAYLEQRHLEQAVKCEKAALAAIGKMEPPAVLKRAAWQVQIDALQSRVHLTLGSALLEQFYQTPQAELAQNRLKDAASNLQQALDRDPRSAMASYRLASAFAAEHDSADAIRYYAWTVALGGSTAQIAQPKLAELCSSENRSMAEAVAEAQSEIEKQAAQMRDHHSTHQ